jgi:hypothetical protein
MALLLQATPRVPANWPPDVAYAHSPDWRSVAPEDLARLQTRTSSSGDDDGLPGVTIRRLTDPEHPACGQRGLFAAQPFAPGDVLGEYTGKVPRSKEALHARAASHLWDLASLRGCKVKRL